MKEQKLISMVARIDELQNQWMNNSISEFVFLKRSCLHKDFLKQPLTLGMFVPCDLEGNVLTKPESFDSQFLPLLEESKIVTNQWFRDCQQYQQAKERVLFEGFKEISFFDEIIHLTHESGEGFNFALCETINELANYFPEDIILTPTACKQIGLNK